MTIQLTAISSLIFFTAFVNILVAYTSWQRRKTRGGVYFALAMTAMVVWTLVSGLHFSLAALPLKVLLAKAEYLGNMVALACFAAFALSYAGYEAWLEKIWVKILLFGLPAANILLAWTNELHGWLWTDFIPSSTFEHLYIFVHGPAYTWVVMTSYALLGVIFVSLLTAALGGTQLARKQAGLLLLSLVVLVMGHLIYLFDIFNLPGVDWSPITFSIAGLLMLYALYGSRFMDVVPVARNAMIEHMADGVLVLDAQGHLLDYNPAAQEIFGLEQANLGSPARAALARWPEAAALLENLGQAGAAEFRSGEPPKYYDLQLTPLADGQNQPSGLLVALRDITQRVQAEQALAQANQQLEQQLQEIEVLQAALREQAIRDALTGLYNRRYLLDALERVLNQAERQAHPVGILLVDIDHFKAVNDTYGHPSGDAYLAGFAHLLQQHFRKSDILCRYGGEEFLIVLPASSLEASAQRAEELRQLAETSAIPFEGREIRCTVSIGLASFPQHGQESSQLISRADQALYASKQAGRNQLTVWSPGLPGAG
ncbi:MAG: diguanylate cyclase [Anaerolineales bacterium]|nr:diguanylate cyclase [Anaerolineales bacterium]